MKIHHLNCGTLCPLGSRFMYPSGKMICHCLLIETSQGLVLIDTGLGVADLTDPFKRLGSFALFARLERDLEGTAVAQVKKLGFSPDDVRHIVVTHLDLDHTGGLADFPRAQVHLYRSEFDAAMTRKSFLEKLRYHPTQWAHGVSWVPYTSTGEKWFGFDCVKQLKGLPPEILIVPLLGHTRGHSGIAVQTDRGWILHAGDAYFSQDEMNLTNPHCSVGLKIFQWAMAMDNRTRLSNQQRLRELISVNKNINIISAHDPLELERAQKGL